MVEVFKTNVNSKEQAVMLVDKIHTIFSHYTVNFDLDDCDNVLRVTSNNGIIDAALLIDLLRDYGIHAEVLPDIIEPSYVFEFL